jgi:GNAT superfamily N-acetyltransferase
MRLTPAARYEPAPARRPSQRGRPRLKGERLPNLSVVAEDPSTVWKPAKITNYPSYRGKGLGRSLLEFAEGEARRAGFDSIYLYTHEKMTENLAIYSRIGYV